LAIYVIHNKNNNEINVVRLLIMVIKNMVPFDILNRYRYGSGMNLKNTVNITS
jgi:hypothetical protein